MTHSQSNPKVSAKTAATGAAAGAAAVASVLAASLAASSQEEVQKECPPDVAELGRSSWTLLHSIAATYPAKPTSEQQQDMSVFMRIFAKVYPCWFCASDFEKFIVKNEPKVRTQEEFGKWLCDAHNEVNVKLGKPKFDCNLWKQRWKDGWDDGSCD